MTPKFYRTPGFANCNTIDYETNTGKAIYRQAARQFYSDIKGKFTLTSEDLIPFFGLLIGHTKSCVWEIFEAPIATTGSRK